MPPIRDRPIPVTVIAPTPAVCKRPSLSEGLNTMQAAGGGDVLKLTSVFLMLKLVRQRQDIFGPCGSAGPNWRAKRISHRSIRTLKRHRSSAGSGLADC